MPFASVNGIEVWFTRWPTAPMTRRRSCTRWAGRVPTCTSPGGVAPSYPLHGADDDQMVAAATATPDPEQLAGLGRQLQARAGHDVLADLPSITSPTLVCAGRYDDIAPLANSELLAERIPDATLRVFEGGHIFMVQDRTAFPAIIDVLGAGS